MSDRICKTDLTKMFAEAAKQIRREHEALSQLDCIGGDGDHGAAMLRAIESIEGAMETSSAETLNEILKEAGWAVLGVDGGASTALLGTFIAGMGDAAMGKEGDCEGLAASFEAGLRALSKQTKAQPGDKTMMDALVPAVGAFRAAASSGKPVTEAMKDAATAARAGADATREMIARYGRAKFIGERGRGSPDAGATSIALFFRGFSEALTQMKEA